MPKYEVDLSFKYGFSVDDLNNRLRSNPRYIFVSHTATKKKDTIYKWTHKMYAGTVKLCKEKGKFWVIVRTPSRNQLLGAFVSWLFNNAEDLIYWTEVYEIDW